MSLMIFNIDIRSMILHHMNHFHHPRLFLHQDQVQVAHGVSAFLLDRFLRPAGTDIQFSMSSNGFAVFTLRITIFAHYICIALA